MIKPILADAVRELVGGAISGGETFESITYHDDQTPPTKKQAEDKLAELQAEYDAQEYARARKAEYDALNQFELISDDTNNSTTTHIDAVNAIKAKWPKDNSGPV